MANAQAQDEPRSCNSEPCFTSGSRRVRLIQKQPEPRELTTYRLQPNAKWDGDDSFAAVKQKIRETLVSEQGWLCCYCMRTVGCRLFGGQSNIGSSASSRGRLHSSYIDGGCF